MAAKPPRGGEIDVLGIPGVNQWHPSQGEARRAALAAARLLGPGSRIAHDPRPSRGQPHYHIVDPQGIRISGHFFYGRRRPRRELRGRQREAEAGNLRGEAALEALLRRVDALVDSATQRSSGAEYMAMTAAQRLAVQRAERAQDTLQRTEFDLGLANTQLQQALAASGGTSRALMQNDRQLRQDLRAAQAAMADAQRAGIAAMSGTDDRRNARDAVQQAQARLDSTQARLAQHNVLLRQYQQAQAATRMARRQQERALQGLEQTTAVARQALRDPWYIRMGRAVVGRPRRQRELEYEF